VQIVELHAVPDGDVGDPPALAGTMTTIRAFAGWALALMIVGSTVITRSSAANPSTSRYCTMPAASMQEPRLTSHSALGRITSAQISINSPKPRMPG
jgi:hypothetical protein